jgi:hypothetical protein
MLRYIAYAYKRKHKCSSSSYKFGEFTSKDNIAMLFLLTAFALESKCKSTNLFPTGKNIFLAFGLAREKVSFGWVAHEA